jgi:HEAT repeat protein
MSGFFRRSVSRNRRDRKDKLIDRWRGRTDNDGNSIQPPGASSGEAQAGVIRGWPVTNNRRRFLIAAAAVALVGGNVFAWWWVDDRAERRHRDHEEAVRQQAERIAEHQQQVDEQREVDFLVLALRTSPEVRNEAANRIRETVRKDGPESKAGRVGLRALIVALGESNVEVRRVAAWTLGRIGAGAKEAGPALIKAVDDSDAIVRAGAAGALGRIGYPATDVVPVLTKALGDTNDEVRRSAAVAIADIGPDASSAAPALLRTWADRDNDAGSYLVNALMKIGPGAVPALIPALAHHKVEVRRMAAELLGSLRLAAKDAVPALAKLLTDDEQLRERAALTLGLIGPDAIPALVAALADKNPAVRKAAISGLRASPDVTVAIPDLAKTLTDADVEVRRAAAHALTAGGGGLPYYPTTGLTPERAKAHANAFPALVKALEDPDAQVRASAAEALRLVGPKVESAIPELSQLLGDLEFVGKQAAVTLGWVGPAAAPGLMQFLSNTKPGTRPDVALAVVEALGRIGPNVKEIRPALVKALPNLPPDAQVKAAETLGWFGASDDAALGLAGLLKSSYAPRSAALSSLAEFGPGAKAAVPALVHALTNPKEVLSGEPQWVHPQYGEKIAADVVLRRKLTYALSQIGPEAKAAVPALAQAVSDPDFHVRGNAVRALGAIGPDAAAAVPDLIKALSDPESEIRKAAATALGKIGPRAKEAIPALEGKSKDDRDYEVRRAAAQALEEIRKSQ